MAVQFSEKRNIMKMMAVKSQKLQENEENLNGGIQNFAV